MNTVTMMINLHVLEDGLLESIHVNGSRVPTASASEVGYSTNNSRAANMPAPPPPDVFREMFGDSGNKSIDREAPKGIDANLDALLPEVNADVPPSLTSLDDLQMQGASTVDKSPPDIDAGGERDSDEYPPDIGVINTSSPSDDIQPPAV